MDAGRRKCREVVIAPVKPTGEKVLDTPINSVRKGVKRKLGKSSLSHSLLLQRGPMLAMGTARPPGATRRDHHETIDDSSEEDHDFEKDAAWHAHYYHLADS